MQTIAIVAGAVILFNFLTRKAKATTSVAPVSVPNQQAATSNALATALNNLAKSLSGKSSGGSGGGKAPSMGSAGSSGSAGATKAAGNILGGTPDVVDLSSQADVPDKIPGVNPVNPFITPVDANGVIGGLGDLTSVPNMNDISSLANISTGVPTLAPQPDTTGDADTALIDENDITGNMDFDTSFY